MADAVIAILLAVEKEPAAESADFSLLMRAARLRLRLTSFARDRRHNPPQSTYGHLFAMHLSSNGSQSGRDEALHCRVEIHAVALALATEPDLRWSAANNPGAGRG